jgi:hypothetical protein
MITDLECAFCEIPALGCMSAFEKYCKDCAGIVLFTEVLTMYQIYHT